MATGGPMTLPERERQVLQAAPTHDELVMRLRSLVKDELVAGMTTDAALPSLEELRRQGPAYEDVALDVMDFVSGWSSPHVSLR